MTDPRKTSRSQSHQVMVGGVPIGGDTPVTVQSMTNVPTTDVPAVLEQIAGLAELGCELIRVAIPDRAALPSFGEVCAASPIPVIADVHFDHTIAIDSIGLGAAKIRINPGNIGSMERVDAVIEAAGAAGVPIRIGVNAGSLDPVYREKGGWALSDKLVGSSLSFVKHFEERGFNDIVLSAKAHNVMECVDTYRKLAAEIPHVPLHLGITEAGTSLQGTVKSAVGLGILLDEGIGSTMRVSLTADPREEIKVAWSILSSVGLRRLTPELVSCPTCGRCQVDLVSIADEVTDRLAELRLPISVAVMGCVVNGPGEAKDADIGVACGRGKAALFAGGEIIRTVPEDRIVEALFEEIAVRFPETEV